MAQAKNPQTGMTREEILELIESALKDAIANTCIAPKLQEAIDYAVLGPGKRLRPILTILAAQAAGGRAEDAMNAAVALELAHAFSLVHDDLPALDDDEIRRGRPTLHKVMGEDMAILAGDALQALAVRTAAASPTSSLEIVEEVLQAIQKMIDGQVMDTTGDFPDQLPATTKLELIHSHKTGAIFVAACRCGGLAARAPEETMQHLKRFGGTIGLMFQVVDDLIDETQSTEHLGKTAGKDHATGKRTYPALIGIEATRQKIRSLAEEAKEALLPLGDAAAPLLEITNQLANRTK